MNNNPFEFIDDIEPRAKEELINPPKGITLSWWQEFNELFGGLRLHELTIQTASTGSGKTTFAANIICQGLLAGIGSYICSAEIGNVMFVLAMYSAFERKDYVLGDRFDKNIVNDLILRYQPILRSNRLVFSRNDDRINPKTLIEEIEKAQKDFGIKLVILDNLQFFTLIENFKNERQVMDETIRDFTRFVRKTPVHCFLIVHPRKGGGGHIVSEEDFKGSSTIYQEASNAIALNKLTNDFLKQNPTFSCSDRELIIFKNRRRGRNAGKSVYFGFEEGRYTEKRCEVEDLC